MKSFRNLMFVAAAFLAAASASAGTPTVVRDTSTNVAYGTGQVLAVWKDTTSGNRVAVQYSSGVQYITDNASWAKHAEVVAGLFKPVADPASTIGLVVDAAKVGYGYCSTGGVSYVGFPNLGQPIQAAGCGLAQAL